MKTTCALAATAIVLCLPQSAAPAAAGQSSDVSFGKVEIPWQGGATFTLVDRDVSVPATRETYFGAGTVTATSDRPQSPRLDVVVKGTGDIPCPPLQTGLLHVTAKTFGSKFSGAVRIFAYTNTVLDGSLLDDDRLVNGQFTRTVTVKHSGDSPGPQTMTLLKICAPQHG